MSLRKILQAATLEQAAPLEAAVREIVQHDVVSLRSQHNEADAAARNQLSAEHLNALRVSDASLVEIDRVILELQHMQGMLRSEGERVCQDIAGYANLNQAAMSALKVIGDSLKQWNRGAPPARRLPITPMVLREA